MALKVVMKEEKSSAGREGTLVDYLQITEELARKLPGVVSNIDDRGINATYTFEIRPMSWPNVSLAEALDKRTLLRRKSNDCIRVADELLCNEQKRGLAQTLSIEVLEGTAEIGDSASAFGTPIVRMEIRMEATEPAHA